MDLNKTHKRILKAKLDMLRNEIEKRFDRVGPRSRQKDIKHMAKRGYRALKAIAVIYAELDEKIS